MEFVGLFLDKEKKAPLYSQLYNYLSEKIRSGSLEAGEKLPSKRTTATQLGISVNTVDEAYQMLTAEGYIESRPRSGFTICKLEQMIAPPQSVPVSSPLVPLPTTQQNKNTWHYSFTSGGMDTSLFPYKMWNRIFKEVLAEGPALFAPGESMGDEALRTSIATYLQGYRGVRCNADQIAVGAGLEVLTGMLARLFPGATIALEDPGYTKTRHVLQNVGIRTCFIDVDSEGMQPLLLENSGAQIAYLTPSHQFPTGGIMPAGRRTALLRWAAQGERIIIEDDYDSEFRFDGRPLPCLQGMDRAGHVVYAGTFSRSLAPGIRAAYLVLPPSVLSQWKKLYGNYSCTISRPEQHTLARFMSEGHFSRSLNRMRAAYRKRRNLLLDSLKAWLPPIPYKIVNAHTGLYLLLYLPGIRAEVVSKQAEAAGIRIHTLASYSTDIHYNKKEHHLVPPIQQADYSSVPFLYNDALILGYGGISDAHIDAAVMALAKVIQNSMAQ